MSEQIPITRGSVIQTYNKSIKKDFLMVVLAVGEVYTCIKLTDNPLFKQVSSIRVDVSRYELDKSKFKRRVTMYANVFGGTSVIKPEYVVKVFQPLKMQEYFGIITAMVSYYLGFYHVEPETGEYIIDTPYIRDPIYTMLFGMVPVAEVISQEASFKARNDNNVVKDAAKEIDAKTSDITRVRKSSDIVKVFDSLKGYPDDMQLRIEAIFKAFDSYLLDGTRLPVKQISEAISGKAPLKHPQKNSLGFTREEIGYLVSNSNADIAAVYGCDNTRACAYKRMATICYYGRSLRANKKSNKEIEEYIATIQASIKRLSRKDAVSLIAKKFGITDAEANDSYNQYINISRPAKKKTKKEVFHRDTDDRLLSVLNIQWITKFDRFTELQDKALALYPDRDKVFNGAIKVDTGDIHMDIILLYALSRTVDNIHWFRVLTLPIYRELREKYSKYTFSDVLSRFRKEAISAKTNIGGLIATSPMMSAHIVCSLEEMGEKERFLHKSAGLGNQNIDTKYLCYSIGIYFRNFRLTRSFTDYIGKKLDLTHEQIYNMVKLCTQSAEGIDIGVRKYNTKKKRGEA